MSTPEAPASKHPRRSVLFSGVRFSRILLLPGLIFFVRVKGERIPILHLLHGEVSSRVVGPLREIVPYKKVLMSTWRVYVSSSTCPQLMAKIGRICDKIAYGKLLYPVRGMKASIYIKRSRFGKRGSFCLYSGAAPATGTLQQQNEIQY